APVIGVNALEKQRSRTKSFRQPGLGGAGGMRMNDPAALVENDIDSMPIGCPFPICALHGPAPSGFYPGLSPALVSHMSARAPALRRVRSLPFHILQADVLTSGTRPDHPAGYRTGQASCGAAASRIRGAIVRAASVPAQTALKIE